VRGPFRVAGVHWWLADDVDAEATRPRLARCVAAWREGALVDRKSGRRKALYGVRLAGPPGREAEGPADHLLKVTRYAGTERLRRRLRGTKARAELARAEAVAARGLPTPVPHAAGEWRTGPGVRACLLLVPLLPDVEDLRVRAQSPGLTPSARRCLAEAFGDLARRIADAGLFQDDFAPNNFLVSCSDPRALWLVDFERAHLRDAVPPGARRFMLAKLHREMPDASAADRLRFLRAYTADASEARRLWRDLEGEVRRLAARDLARMARTATHPGRRFTRLRTGVGRGYAYGDDAEARRLAGAAGDPGTEATPDHLVWRRAGLRPGEARALWVRQAWLAARGLAAPPRALLRHPDGRTTLVTRRPAGDRPLDAAPAPERQAAVAVLLARTLALGELAAAGPAPGAIRLAPARSGVLRAFWVAPPDGLRPGAPPEAGGSVRARRLAGAREP
jgi:3-deoxy-D-manno-octulosonic acid kinase